MDSKVSECRGKGIEPIPLLDILSYLPRSVSEFFTIEPYCVAIIRMKNEGVKLQRFYELDEILNEIEGYNYAENPWVLFAILNSYTATIKDFINHTQYRQDLQNKFVTKLCETILNTWCYSYCTFTNKNFHAMNFWTSNDIFGAFTENVKWIIENKNTDDYPVVKILKRICELDFTLLAETPNIKHRCGLLYNYTRLLCKKVDEVGFKNLKIDTIDQFTNMMDVDISDFITDFDWLFGNTPPAEQFPPDFAVVNDYRYLGEAINFVIQYFPDRILDRYGTSLGAEPATHVRKFGLGDFSPKKQLIEIASYSIDEKNKRSNCRGVFDPMKHLLVFSNNLTKAVMRLIQSAPLPTYPST